MIAERELAPVAGLSSIAFDTDFTVRDATPGDNDQLIELAAACAMKGDITIRIDRGPDFFALNRLEGDRWKVGVAERAGRVIGCIAVSDRRVFANGSAIPLGYVGDFKVHPRHRDTRIADALSHYAEAVCAELPPTAPVMITVLAGNHAMERRLAGPRGVPAFRRIGTIRTHSIPILWRRRLQLGATRVDLARWSDLDQMARLWNIVARQRQLAPAFNADDLAAFIRNAPGLDISSYRIARSPAGEMLGFLAVWDQRSFKQLTVVGYSKRMRITKLAFNTLASIAGLARMPREGSTLDCVTIAHVCVPSNRADVLRALMSSAYSDLQSAGVPVMNIGLDIRDPLSDGLRGLCAQPTDVNAYVMTTRRGVLPELLDIRPLHYEIALV